MKRLILLESLLLGFFIAFTSCNENSSNNNNSYSNNTNSNGNNSITEADTPELFLIEKNDKYGYIDRTGKIIIEPQFEEAHLFHEGLAYVQILGNNDKLKEYYIDKTGKIVINQEFELRKSYFSEGLALIAIMDYYGTYNEEYGFWVNNDKYGFIDKTGKCVINPQFEYAEEFHEGLSCVHIGALGLPGGKTGYINHDGEFIIQPQFHQGESFSEGLASVEISNKWGYIDKTGQTIIPIQFDKAYPFSEGLARIQIDEKWGFIDKTGRIIINPTFDYAHDFHEGLAYVEIGEKSGYINKSGQYTIMPQFETGGDEDRFSFDSEYHVNDFSEGLAAASIDGKYYFIEKSGRIAIAQPFYDVTCFHNGFARVWWNSEDDSSIIDKTGKIIWTDRFSGV